MKTFERVAIMVLWSLTAVLSPAQSAKLAILATGEADQTAADLLVVRLSTDPQVTVLERTEIERVMREQELSLTSAEGALAAGRLLGADGLFVLERDSSGMRPVMSVGLVAVKPGVLLWQSDHTWPQESPERWAELIVRQCRSLWPKLMILPKDAVPVSILNLRSAVRSRPAELMERELTTLLYKRLARQPEMFVPERRRMRELDQESVWAGLERPEFWSSGFLIDGLIDQEGYRPDLASIHVRILAADNSALGSFEVEGSRTNLSGLVAAMADRTVNLVEGSSVRSEWDASAEAEEFFREAEWAFQWRLFREAAQAAEASWALGCQTPQVALLRIRAYLEAGTDPVLAMPAYPQFRMRSNYGAWSSNLHPAYWHPPDPERFADYLRAVELYEAAWHLFVESQPELEASWLDLGMKLMDRGSWWLRHYYFVIEARAGREADLAGVKAAMQRLTRLMQRHSGYVEARGDRALPPVLLKHGAFWADTPEQALAEYQVIMDEGRWGDGRRRFVNADRVESGFRQLRKNKPVNVSQFQLTPADGGGPANPPIPGWSWTERLRGDDLWGDFVDQLCNSTNGLQLLEGYYLRCAGVSLSDAFEREWTVLIGAVEAQMDQLPTKQALDTWEADLQWLLASRVEALDEAQRKRVVNEIWSAFQRRKSETSKQLPTRARAPAIITRAQTTQAPSPTRSGPASSSSAIQPMTDAVPGVHHTLEVKRFWEVPVRPVTDATINDAPEIAAWCFREGRLWLDMRYAPPGSTREVHLAGVDLETLQAVHVQLDIEQFNLPFLAPSHPQERVFEVKGDDLYLGLNDGLRRYSLSGKTWSRVPLPVEGQVRPFRLGDRLILTGQESILELMPDDSVRILASCRRRPPQSILDERPTFGRPVPPVFLLEDQTLGAFLGGKIYRRGPGDKDWTEAPFEGLDTRVWQVSSSENVLFLTRSSPQGGGLQAIHGSASTPELLLEWNATSPADAMRPRMPSSRSTNAPAPRWKLPQAMAGKPFAPHLANDGLWTFVGPLEFERDGAKGIQMKAASLTDAFLLRFDADGVSPSVMALDFQFHLSAPARDSVTVMLRKPNWTTRPSLHHGPGGICLTQTGVPGFWHLPADELARGVTFALQQRGGNKTP